MKRNNTPASAQKTRVTIFSPAKTLFNFGFKQSQSPCSLKGSSLVSSRPENAPTDDLAVNTKIKQDVIDLSEDVSGKNQNNNPNSISESPEGSGYFSNDKTNGQKRDSSTQLSFNDDYDSHPSPEKKLRLASIQIHEDQLDTSVAHCFKATRLGLVRIEQVDSPLHSLCDFIYKTLVSGVANMDCYYLREGVTIGRQSVTSSNESSCIMNIGIPSDERLISREHLDIVHIEKDKSVTFPPTQHNFSAENKPQLCSFLQHAQSQLPKMKIRVNDTAKNSIRIHKRRVVSNLTSTIQNQETLHRGQESTLSVGDVILFDASIKTRKKYYLYRLMAIDVSSTEKDCPSFRHSGTESPNKRPEPAKNNESPLLVQKSSAPIEIFSPPFNSRQESNHRKTLSGEDMPDKNSSSQKGPYSCTTEERIPNLRSSKRNQASKTEQKVSISNDNVDNCRKDNIVEKRGTSSNTAKISQPDMVRPMNAVSEPVCGDRFRVLFSVYDCFGRIQETWYFGTVVSIKKKRKNLYSLDIYFDDETTETVDYPDEEVERLWENDGNDNTASSVVYALDSHEKPSQIAYDSKPKELVIGDLVICQNRSGKFCYGRIASVDSQRKTFDIFYFNKDFEEGLPLINSNFYLVKRGKDDMNWMVGLTIPSSLFKPSLTTESTIVMQGVHAVIKHPNGDLDRPQYDELVRILFLHHRSFESEKDKVSRKPLVATSRIVKKIPYTFYTKSTTHFEQHKWTADNKIEIEKIEQDEKSDVVNTSILPEIHPMNFANQLWRSINSSQPHNGFGILSHLAEVFDRYPTDSLHVNLQDFLIEGPKSDGVKIRDPNKTELVYRYTNFIAENCFHSWRVCSIHPRSWDECQKILYLPSRDCLTQCDEMTDTAIRRMLQGLQFSSLTLDFVSKLILNEIKDSTEQKQLSRSRNLYRSKTIIGYALNHGIRESLKTSIRSFMKCWIEYETFRLRCFTSGSGQLNEIHRCLDELEGCLKSLGAVASSLSWCYCAENGLGFGSKDCCVLYRDILESEIRNSCLTFQGKGEQGLSKKDDFIFRIILSIRTNFSFPLEANLAEMFRLPGAFSSVFESLGVK